MITIVKKPCKEKFYTYSEMSRIKGFFTRSCYDNIWISNGDGYMTQLSSHSSETYLHTPNLDRGWKDYTDFIQFENLELAIV